MNTLAIAAYLYVNIAFVSAKEFSEEWIEWKNLYEKIYESEGEELACYVT